MKSTTARSLATVTSGRDAAADRVEVEDAMRSGRLPEAALPVKLGRI
jgi:hypothetical protein